MPELIPRLNAFEEQMDGFDHRVNGAQDQFATLMNGEENHFVARVAKELPKVMDKYVNQKLNRAKRQVSDVQPRDTAFLR